MNPPHKHFQFGLRRLFGVMLGISIVAAVLAESFAGHAAQVVILAEGLIGLWAFHVADRPR